MGSIVSGLNMPGSSDTIQYEVPVNAATIVVRPMTTLLIVDPASALLLLNVTLPSAPMDGQRLVIASSAMITAINVTGGTIKGVMTGLAINGYARFAYSASAGAWFRTG